jgi:hypothetical protein
MAFDHREILVFHRLRSKRANHRRKPILECLATADARPTAQLVEPLEKRRRLRMKKLFLGHPKAHCQGPAELATEEEGNSRRWSKHAIRGILPPPADFAGTA